MLFWLPLVIMTALTALIGMLIGRGYVTFRGHLLQSALQPGAPIVYRMIERSTRPAPQGCDIRPAKRGELYHYLITKYWRVEKVLRDGSVVAITPLMEHHVLRSDDPNLRKANLLERLRYGGRFPRPV